MVQDKLIQKIADRLQAGNLPGPEAQYRMAHIGRNSRLKVPASARKAGVMALLYPAQEDWNLVLIERQHHPKDQHKGQISFPGGKHDPGDPDLKFTALRETEEEVGIDRNSIEVLGQLTDLYIPVSNFLVSPFVGFVDHPPDLIPDHSEVRSILTPPISLFLEREVVGATQIQINQDILLKNVPYFPVENKILWGATAMMLSELLYLLDA